MSGIVSRKSRRIQAGVDSGAALVLAMLAWPFPLARAMLPLPVNILSVLVFWQLVQVGYCAVAAAVWGGTAGTLVAGISLVAQDGAEITRANRAKWGALAGATALAHVVSPPTGGSPALAERVTGVRLESLSAVNRDA